MTDKTNKTLSTLQSHKSKLLTQKSQLDNLLRKQARLNSEINKLKKCIHQNSKNYLRECKELLDLQDENLVLVLSESKNVLSEIESNAEENFVFIKNYIQEVEELSFEYLENYLDTIQRID